MTTAAETIQWFYTDQGQGEPVLFLHGGFDCSANYTRLLESLAHKVRIIAVDRRGHGRTPDTSAPFDYELMAQELADFATTIGLPEFHVIGYSDGANIGFHLASLYPNRIKSLISISGNYKGLDGMSQEWLDLISELSLELILEQMPEIIEQYTMLNPAPYPEQFISKTKTLWNQQSVISKEKLETLQVKTLIVGGDSDIVLPEHLLEMQRLIPKASLLVLPRCGHFIFQDFAFSPTAESAMEIFLEFITTQFSNHLVDL